MSLAEEVQAVVDILLARGVLAELAGELNSE